MVQSSLLYSNYFHSVWILSGISLIAVIVLDLLIGNYFFELSIKLSIEFQKINLFQIAYFCSFPLIFLIYAYSVGALYLRKRKQEAFLSFISIGICIFLLAIAKLVYSDTRPSFASEKLLNALYFCESDYGKPSGHAMSSTCMSILILHDSMINFKEKIQRNLSKVICGLIPAMVCASRVYFGVHSLNQITLGIFFGIFCAFTLIRFKKTIYQNFLEPIIERGNLQGGSTKSTIVFFSLWAASFALMALMLIWVYKKEKINWPDPIHTPFFDGIANCKYTILYRSTNFGPKVIGEGMLLQFFFAFLLGLKLSPVSFSLSSTLSNSKYPILSVFKFILAIAPSLLLILIKYPRVNNSVLFVAKHMVVANLVGFLTGYCGLKLCQVFRLIESAPEENTQELTISSADTKV